jgi:ubiquinone/menaquinone biosynthesis C-methylase UbiE
MDARALDFIDASFDHVTAFYFFMYLPKADHPQALREAYRVLRPGGQLHIWDAVIEEDALFMVDLDVDLEGQRLHTGYGVQKSDPVQDMAHFLALAKAAGFLPKSTAQSEGQLCLHLEKPPLGGQKEAGPS